MNGEKNSRIYGVRSDLHGRVELSKEHFRQVKEGLFTGLFDLGDFEAEYIPSTHPLRKDQGKDEETCDAIIRNALKHPQIMRKVIAQILSTSSRMKRHLIEERRNKCFYRGIAGNSEEVWQRICYSAGTVQDYDNLMNILRKIKAKKRAKAEFVVKGTVYSFDDIVERQLRPEAALLYLPWKTELKYLFDALDKLSIFDPARIVILSHDYLSMASIPKEYRDSVRANQNEEQVSAALDSVCEHGRKIESYFGHIGPEFPVFCTTFSHKGADVTAYHTDEKDCRLLELRL